MIKEEPPDIGGIIRHRFELLSHDGGCWGFPNAKKGCSPLLLVVLPFLR